MAKETQSPKVKHRKPGRGIHEGDKVVRREKSHKAATSSTDRPAAPGTNYMKDRNRREWEAKQRRQARRQETIRERGLVMLGILEKKMQSTSQAATSELLTIAATYLGSYIEVRDIGWPERHREAKEVALEGCTPALRRYAERQLDNAEWHSRPPKKADKAADQPKLANAS